MAPPFKSIRSALHFWMRGRRRNDESSTYSEQDWWPLSSNAKSHHRTPPFSSLSSGQWSSVVATDEASSGSATSSRGSSSHGSLQQSNSAESATDSSIQLTDRRSKESLVHGGTPWQGLQNVSQNMRAPAIACIVFVGAFATAMVIKSSFRVLSGEENAEFASDLPVHLQLPSRPLQPDDSGPSVKFSHRLYNGSVKRGRFVPRKESSVATTVFSTEGPDETSGTKSLLLDIISSAEPSSRIPKTRKIGRKFSENDSVSSTATQFELSVSTSITSTVSQLSSTTTTSESSVGAIATLLSGRTFAFSHASHPGITNVTSVSSELTGNVIANRSTDTTSSSSSYQAINTSYQASNASYSGSAAGETTTWLKSTNFTSSTELYRGRVAVGSDSTSSSASPWSKARSFVNSFSPSTSTITLDSRSFNIETVQNVQLSRATMVAYYSTGNTATASESADMIRRAPDSRSMNRSSTAREAAPSSAALSGIASSHASPATSAKDEREDRSSLGELMSDARGIYSTFETRVAFRGTISEAGEKPGQSTKNKQSWLVGDPGQNSMATSIRIGKIVTTMMPINSSLSANISGQY